MGHRIRLDLRIMDFDCSPDEITRLVGIEPTRVWMQGDLIHPKASVRHKECGWELRADEDLHITFHEAMQRLMANVGSSTEKIAELSRRFHIELSCAVYISTGADSAPPWIHLAHDEVDFLHRIGAELDFDMYLTGADVG